MRIKKDLMDKCTKVGSLTLQKDALELEIKTLREAIDAEMKAGEQVDFNTDNQDFSMIKRLEDKAVMKDNETLFKLLGKKNFVESAKFSKTDIEKSFGKAVVADCIDHFESTTKLLLKKNE